MDPESGDRHEQDQDGQMPVDEPEALPAHEDDEGFINPNNERLLLERSRFAECGVITKIKLINFMCHEHLEVKLSPHVNFIHGENGSGKSAILVAISTCLGVKASDTNRGSSLKELIRQGEDWGQVELTLANNGSDAFVPEKYGKHITVRREITKTISTYKIMNDRGLVVGRTKKDLQGILDHFNIQVENPCVVMNQDTTKEFLLSNKNSSKYDFFLKATQLEQMGNSIDVINKDFVNSHRYLGEAQKQLELLEQNLKEREHLYNCTQDLAIIDRQIDKLNHECLWAKVQELGHEVDNKRSTASEYSNKLQELHDQMSKLQIEKNMATQAYDDAKQCLLVERNAITGDVELRQELENSLQTAKKTVVRFQSQQAQYEKNEKTAIKRRDDLQQQLQQLEAQRSRDRHQEDEERAEQIHKLKLRSVEQSDQVQEAQLQADQARRELDQGRDAVNQNTSQLHQRRSYHQEMGRELQRLERAAADQLDRFGRDMSSLVRKIQSESRTFRVPPVGPIGAYVSVRDKHHSAAVQLAIGKNNLCGFVVDSFDDQKVLSKLFQSFCRNPKDTPKIIVLQKPTSRYDIVARNVAYGDHPRVVDVVDISDTWCYNALIDKCQIEFALLLPDASSAKQLLRQMEQRREMTPVVYTRQLNRISISKGSLSNVSNQSGDNINCILNSVTEADLDDRRRAAREVLGQIESIEAEALELKRNVDRVSNASRLASRKVQSLTSDLDTTKADIANLEKQAAFDDDHVGGLVFDLHDRIAKCDQLIDDANHDMSLCQENLAQAKEEYEQKLREVDEFNEKASKAGSGLEYATEQVNLTMKAVAEVQFKIEKIGPLQHTMERKVQSVMQEVDTLVEKLERVRQEALAQTGRVVETDRSSAGILKEIYKMEEKKQADRDAISTDSIEQIIAAFVKAKEDFDAALLKVTECERDCNRIEKKLKSSSKDWEIFKKRLSKQASYDFQYNMSQKGHQGHIQFDHDRGTLQMYVKMQHHEGENEFTSDTKALSGGERSYTTLAFVIAVGESIRTPFRALDEFDIFMDSVNRKIAINLLLELAKKYRNRQFIFITPQDVSMIVTSPTTFVLMLKPPVRPAN